MKYIIISAVVLVICIVAYCMKMAFTAWFDCTECDVDEDDSAENDDE